MDDEEHPNDMDDDIAEINIILPNTSETENIYVENIPMFIKKLWKMVNEKTLENIISWGSGGNSFIISNQLAFVSKVLPKYFKHNNLASFIRQLNIYDFHKVQNIENKDELEFMHCFFLKDCPELIPLIKRKYSVAKLKTTRKEKVVTKNVDAISNTIQDLKSKNAAIEGEIARLGQERSSLYREIGSLRLKYSKQSKVVNKLIHFLISYIHKHPNTAKHKKSVGTKYQESLKQGPKIMELESHKSPSNFWSDFDTQESRSSNLNEPNTYIVTEPECPMETDVQKDILEGLLDNSSNSNLPEVLPYKRSSEGTSISAMQPSTSLATLQSTSSSSESALKTTIPTDANIGYHIDNTQVELANIKELLKTLTSDDIADFYKLVNENLKVQESEESLATDYSLEPEIDDSILMPLSELSQINKEQEKCDAIDVIGIPG
ncbi:heat shock factor protein 1-like [Cylas formicarius]|uniref:heat shock factor protein 1-like n=1 Tax=Cylas formicarius TaxID=197179 RepID=UPI0029589C11|nr:heat shock factor protein 1-like [Cylas formicarius]